MKKLFGFIAIVAMTIVGMSSCLNGKGAEATITYVGTCDTIIYTDTTNAKFDKFIKEAVTKVFEESATSDESMSIYAEAKCNDLAIKTWKSIANSYTKEIIANQIFKAHSDTLARYMGIQNSVQLSEEMKPMTLKTKLISATMGIIYAYPKEIE